MFTLSRNNNNVVQNLIAIKIEKKLIVEKNAMSVSDKLTASISIFNLT